MALSPEEVSKKYHTVIEATNPWKPFDLTEIFRYKDFFYYKIVNGYKAQQKQSILGYFWVAFDPAFSILFYSLVFGAVAGIATGDIPYVAFNASAVLGWTYLSGCMNNATSSMQANAGIIQKVYFPRIYIPLVPCIVSLPNFLINTVLTLILLAYFGFYPGIQILAIIPIMFVMIIFSMGLGLLITTFKLQYRDLGRIWGYFMRFYAYAVPMAYPVTAITDQFPDKEWIYTLFMLNPAAPLIEGFRGALLGTPIPWFYIGIAFIVSLILLYVGAVVFRFREPNIVDAL